eukprot:TRINITY_DN3072_c0_g1_i1.p1 TRINITY_DN3072_c0_g1~~TRINITY_DN3072_c0_g1_i1.p1  ORF type:complete len:616 (-),score=117.80 TRINITY_DN3072_c0_g1_i1:33-1880(-)
MSAISISDHHSFVKSIRKISKSSAKCGEVCVSVDGVVYVLDISVKEKKDEEESYVVFDLGGERDKDKERVYKIKKDKAKRMSRSLMMKKPKSSELLGVGKFEINLKGFAEPAFVRWLDANNKEGLLQCYKEFTQVVAGKDVFVKKLDDFDKNWMELLSDDSSRIVERYKNGEGVESKEAEFVVEDVTGLLSTYHNQYTANAVPRKSRSSGGDRLSSGFRTPRHSNTQFRSSLIVIPSNNDQWSNFNENKVSKTVARTPREITEPFISDIICCETVQENFDIETGVPGLDIANVELNILYPQKNVCYYTTGMYHSDHTTYILLSKSRKKPGIYSVQKSRSGTFAKCIFRTEDIESRFWINSESSYKEALFELFPKYRNHKFHHIKKKNICDDLAELEGILVKRHTNYKIGILYSRNGVVTEDDMYSTTDPSDEFYEFLYWLGDEVKLKNFKRYAGGLDTQKNTSGKYSIYTQYSGYEIMFHVANLMPFDDDDTQQIDRKRHLGNDVVIIIYKEGDEPIDLTLFRSQFNHVFVILQRIEDADSEEPMYSVVICSKHGVQETNPPIPLRTTLNSDFRDILITKCLNMERACLNLSDFGELEKRTRQIFIEGLVTNYIK